VSSNSATQPRATVLGTRQIRVGGVPSRFERWTAPWRALPNLLVLGAQKSGTTSLHDYLARHPEIRMSRIKECHVLWKHAWSLREYRAYFPLRAQCRFPMVKCVGESTPYYLFHPSAANAARKLDAAVSSSELSLRAIAVLRDPVERAWSHYQHAVRLGFETQSFEGALQAEDGRLVESDFAMQHLSYQARGLYAHQLERWFEVLGRERILVIEFNELRAMSGDLRVRLRNFLGLDGAFLADFPKMNVGAGEPMPRDARALLCERFQKPNRDLESLLGVRYEWMHSSMQSDTQR
jgi:hypothetical protein